jgi:hypothetical protein
MLTCLSCINKREVIRQGEFVGSDGRIVKHGIIDCASKGQTRIIRLIDCREKSAAKDRHAEGE